MSAQVTIGGRRYRLVRPIAVFLLSIVTLGLYWVVWYYRTNDDVRMFLRNYSIRPLVATLATIALLTALPLTVAGVLLEWWWLLAVAAVLALIGFVGVLRTARRVATAQEHAGVDPSSPGAALLLSIAGAFLAGSYLQAGLNRAWRAAADAERERERAEEDAARAAAARGERIRPFPRPAPGRNLVTPGDLGRRVTFQFELPNGYLSEAVGVFERWDPEAETYFVRKKDGSLVRVPARGVRHGKVIPERPAPAAG